MFFNFFYDIFMGSSKNCHSAPQIKKVLHLNGNDINLPCHSEAQRDFSQIVFSTYTFAKFETKKSPALWKVLDFSIATEGLPIAIYPQSNRRFFLLFFPSSELLTPITKIKELGDLPRKEQFRS